MCHETIDLVISVKMFRTPLCIGAFVAGIKMQTNGVNEM
jgi:hypothetical protein